jgi:hypothetical protein
MLGEIAIGGCPKIPRGNGALGRVGEGDAVTRTLYYRRMTL